MPRIVDRDEVRRLMSEVGAQLLEVLPGRECEHEHPVAALDSPLRELNATAAARLDRRRPVITYCHDYL